MKAKFLVRDKPCDQCLMTKNRIVDEQQANEIVADCNKQGTHFICHKATIAGGQNICCHLFYKTQGALVIQLARMLGIVEFTNESANEQPKV